MAENEEKFDEKIDTSNGGAKGNEETSAQALEVTSLGNFELNGKLSVNENPKLKRMTSFIEPSELKVNESNVSAPNEQNEQNNRHIFPRNRLQGQTLCLHVQRP